MTKKITLSFEIFPPNTEERKKQMCGILTDFKELNPDFISVTCSNNNVNIKDSTVKISDHVQNKLGLETIAHLPALYMSKAEVAETLDALEEIGVRNLLALRGDIIEGVAPKGDFAYASDLIEFIKERNSNFKISAACYPETHVDSANQVQDIKFLKKKVDAGCELLISQLFYDNEAFYDFRDKCQLANIDVPTLAGIMPIINRNQVLRLLSICKSVTLPKKFKRILDKYEHDPVSLRQAGLAYAVDQIIDLVTNDVDGVHLYTMNQPSVAKYIKENTNDIFKNSNIQL
ncbi:MAG: methylenetetrahydrofolate reductase [NAD(P)H] [Gemella sp.]|nr:methylenetetrahydrofolate reductase [NAD(P)H] [Gemella sp.]